MRRKTSAEILDELYARTSGNGWVPPQHIVAEQSVLGAMMISPTAASKVIALIGAITLETTPFYQEWHTKIYIACSKVEARGQKIDLVSAGEELRKLKWHLDEYCSPIYLVELTMKIVTTAHVEDHAKLILEKHLQRQVIIAGEWMKLKAYEGADDTFSLLDQVGARLYEIGAVRYKRGVKTIGTINHDVIESAGEIERRVKESGHYTTGVPSGLHDLDDITTGWQKTDLIILAARPSAGKTACSLHFARNAAVASGRPPTPTAIFSLEMGEEQLALRILCSQAQVNMQKVRKGMVSAEEWKRISKAKIELDESPIFIDDTAGITPMELRSKARRLKQDHDIGLIIVDYIQLMEPDHRQDSREREVSSISRALKALAKELNIPVIALSQLNRSLENRAEKRPMLSDLRESGAIEQDADIVMFIYRPETYGLKNWEDGRSVVNSAEIIVAKQRNGPIGSPRVHFYADTGTYEDFRNDTERVFAEETF